MSETKTKNLCTVPAADLTDSQYFIAEDGGELKRIPKAQVVLKKLENMLATDTENLAEGGEVTAQELLDAIAERVANKLLAKSQVVNNLLATVEGNPLDATQGKALKELIDTTNNNLSKRFSSDSFVYSSIDDIPKSGSCFGTISKSIKIGDVTIPAYSRFSFMNTGNSSDGALFAIDSNGYSYTAYRTSGVWNKCFATATKSDLTDKAKKISQNFQPGSTILNVSSWSAITLLSLVTYKNETTSLYLIRKETSTNIYCIPIKSSTQVSVSYSGENMLTLTDSATYGGTWSVLFLS